MQSGTNLQPVRKILVFGVTGQQGGAVARSLRLSGIPVTGFVRDPNDDGVKALREEGIEIFIGDLKDDQAIYNAMIGHDSVFCVLPNSGQGALYGITDQDEIHFGKVIADAALNAHIKHFVYSSTIAVKNGRTGVPHIDTKAEIEAYLRDRGVPFTILRPATLMETLILPGMGLDRGSYSFFVQRNESFQVVAAEDIGRIAAVIFSHPLENLGRSIEVAGDEITGQDVEVILSRAAQRPISYSKFGDEIIASSNVMIGSSKLFASGLLRGEADIQNLKSEFGHLIGFQQWLTTSGRERLLLALKAKNANLNLR